MWEKKEPETPRGPQPPAPARVEPHATALPPAAAGVSRGRAANIGGSLSIKGEVTGSEDLTVEGHVEGKIDLKDHNLTIAQGGRVNAEIHAKTVTIVGEVTGNVVADEKVEIAETGRLMGDLRSPRVAISDGAQFRGSVDMGRDARPAAVAASASAVKDRIPAVPAPQPKVALQV
jgi:cytoskeletal protein CcmA (bactofilin family)